MKVSLIAAIDQNRLLSDEIGFLWHQPKDIQHFRAYTLAHPHLIVGRTTYEQMLGWFKPEHQIWVLSSNPKVDVPPALGKSVVLPEQIISDAKSQGIEELVCIGGAKTYAALLPHATHLILTHIQHTFHPRGRGCYFPEISSAKWTLTDFSSCSADKENLYAMNFATYEKISR